MIALETPTQIWVGSGSAALSPGCSSAISLKMPTKTGITKATIATSTTIAKPKIKRRVHHRRFDLAAQGVELLDLEGDPVERVLEAARLLAGADHRPEEAVEDLRVALHRLLERAAGLDVGADARRSPP